MNRILLFLLTLLLSCNIGFTQEWQTNFETAKRIAEQEQKTILLVFQGSDWCAPCIKLDREVWTSAVFKVYAAEHFVMLKADFPRKKKNALSKAQDSTNAILAERYNKKGIFPLVVLLNSSGDKLGETGYKRISPKDYIKELNRYLN